MRRLCCLIIWMVGTAAARPSATVIATETNVFLGQVFNVDVIVQAQEKPDAAELTATPDFHVTTLQDGRANDDGDAWIYRFAFRATRKGDLTIPASRFGEAVTRPVSITAREPRRTDRMRLSRALSAASVFVGEPLSLTTTWDSAYLFSAIKAVDFRFPLLNDARFRVIDRYDPGMEKREETTGLPVHGTRVLATRGDREENGVLHQTLAFDKILIPQQSGRFTLPPATLLCAVDQLKEINGRNLQIAFQYPAYFDNTFFDQNARGDKWARVYAESAPLELEVKPLPTEGRPAAFDGLVGEFSIGVDAEPAAARVGESITLTIRVEAARFSEAIRFEPLSRQPQLADHFETSADRPLPAREVGAMVYTRVIRPRVAGDLEIPPLRLAYFSPTSNAYVVAESAPIPIEVVAADEIAMFGPGQPRTGEDEVPAPRFPVWAIAALTSSLIAALLVASGYALRARVFRPNRNDLRRAARAARAFRLFRRRAARARGLAMKSEIYRALDEATRTYLGDRLDLIPGALAFRDVAARLSERGVEADAIEALGGLITICEAYRFTDGFDEEADPKPILQNALRVVGALETALKRSAR